MSDPGKRDYHAVLWGGQAHDRNGLGAMRRTGSIPMITSMARVVARASLAFWAGAAGTMFLARPLGAQLSQPADSAMVASLDWRSIGPANMAGRVTDVEGLPSPSKTFYVATAAGGVWKTTNNGITFKPMLDDRRVVAMGDLAIAPSDPAIVWAGTGEVNSRNSISPGGGIFKSTDAGETWTLMGLEATQTIGRILVHPTNPDRVWVAALGAIWNANPERGLYRTDDGGETWTLVKFISDKAGFVDLVIHPRNPDVLFASSWERVRSPYSLESGGPGSGLWKTTDGGDTWTEVVGGGFPAAEKGRIGLAIALSSPEVMYALVEAREEEDGSGGSGLYRSEDGGSTWTKMNSVNVRPFYYSQVRVDPADPDRVYFSSTPVSLSPDGGASVGQTTLGLHVDHHAMWIDPADPERIVVGNDGGVGITYDRGGNWRFLNTFAIGQFYHASYSMEEPYTVCGGLQDNGTWCGPSRRWQGSIDNFVWANVGGGDGFYSSQDPRSDGWTFVESQGGNISRMNRRTGERRQVARPDWKERWLAWEDSILVLRPDSTRPVSPAVQARIDDFRVSQRADSAAMDLRYNWQMPFFQSPHDPDLLYAAGNRVLKADLRAEEIALEVISPDLSYADAHKIHVSTRTTGGITPDVTGAETHSTIVALAESPLRQGLLLAGTDDGRVWQSENDGGDWTELTARFAGVPDSTWVSRIEPSHHDADRFFVSFDNHRRGDFTPYVFVTHDGGRNFTSIAAGLPRGAPDFVHVIREDPHNPSLLFVGTDVGAYVSTDAGRHWQTMGQGLPTVPVHDLEIHPRDRELIAATHGRSIWIVDIAPLQGLNDAVIAAGLGVFEPKFAYQYGQGPVGGGTVGHAWFRENSPPYGAEIPYYVGDIERGTRATLEIVDADGNPVRTINGAVRAGLHVARWNFRADRPDAATELSPAERQDSVRSARLLASVGDSLVEHEGVPRDVMDDVLGRVDSGRMQGLFGGGGGGAVTRDPDRPGELLPRPPRAGAAAAAGAAATEELEAEEEEEEEGAMSPQDVGRRLFGALRARGISPQQLLRRGGGGGGPGGFGGGPPVEPGQYTVTLRVGDKEASVPFRVTRAGS